MAHSLPNPLPHVHLRAIEPEDLDLLYSIENDDALWDVGNTSVPYSRYTLHDYIANATDDIYADGQVRLIVETPGKQTVGIADIVNFDPKHRRAELGLVIQRQYRRKGYGRSAIARLTDYALRVLHLHQLYVVVATDNQPCVKLFSSMGFDATATLRHWLFDGRSYHDAMLLQTIL